MALAVLLALASAAAGATLAGTVVDNLGGRPLARAGVRVEPAGAAGQESTHSVTADAGGQFQFTDLPPGVYLLRAQRSGYAPARYGQKRWNAPGTPIVLEAETQFAAEIRLRKLGVITGQILDENRAGLPGHRVTAYRAGPRLQWVAGGEADDRGVYRIAGLEPGRYYVRTEGRELEADYSLLPTFYGRVTRAAQAQTVDIDLEQELSGIDIEPLPGRLSALTGRVQSTRPATVTLFTDMGAWSSQVVPGGTFRFDSLAPGRYDLIAEAAGGPEPLAGYQQVSVSRPVEDITVFLAPAPWLQVRCDGGDASVSLLLRRREPSEEGLRRLLCGERAVLAPGIWEFGVVPGSHLYVASIANATPTGTAYEFDLLRHPGLELAVTLRERPATLHGKVTTEGGRPAVGAPVTLYPLDLELRSRLGGLRSTRSGPEGEYRFLGLAPGKYEVLSSFLIEDAAEGAWTSGRGRGVSLDEGSEQTLDLVLVDQP